MAGDLQRNRRRAKIAKNMSEMLVADLLGGKVEDLSKLAERLKKMSMQRDERRADRKQKRKSTSK